MRRALSGKVSFCITLTLEKLLWKLETINKYLDVRKNVINKRITCEAIMSGFWNLKEKPELKN